MFPFNCSNRNQSKYIIWKHVIVFFIGLFLLLLISFSIYVAIVYDQISLKSGLTLRVFKASSFNNRKSTIMILPGGGYSSLGKWNEGYLWVPFLHSLGYTVAVLEYRMPHYDYSIPISDASEAMVALRKRTKDFGYDINKIGLMGFSAGGHLASTMMVSENDSIRPNFVLLFYPVVSMRKEITHMGSHNNFLGKDASINLELQYSNELHVSANNPPVFIAVSKDDRVVNPINSIILSDEIKQIGRPVSLHIYPEGGHGWGYMRSFPYRKQMIKDMMNWLDSILIDNDLINIK